MTQTTIKLFNPYDKQMEVIRAIEDDSNFFITVVAGRQVGKSLLGLNLAVKWAVDNKRVTIFWCSPTDSQAHKAYIQLKDAIVETGIIKSHKGASGDTEVVLVNGSRILFRSAMSEDSLRGEAVHYMILDEAAFMKKNTVDTILLPMLAVKGRKCLCITTPKGKNWVHDWYSKGFDTPKWKSFHFTTNDSPYANKELIDAWRDSLPEKAFQQEVLAEFIDSASVFKNVNELLCLPLDQGPIAGQNYYGGIDIGLINDSSVLSIIDQNGNLVKYIRWTGIEAPDLINAIQIESRIWNLYKIYIENNGVGLPIYHDLKRKMMNIEEFNTNSKSKGEIINQLIHKFNTKTIKLINDDLLRMELESFLFTQKDGRVKYEAASGFHDDIIMSLAIGQECYETYRRLKFNPIKAAIYGGNSFRTNDW